MNDFRVEYGTREITKHSFVNGVDTGEPDPYRTFEQGPPTFYVDDVKVELHAFLIAVEYEQMMQGNAIVETRLYGPAEAVDWDVR